MSNSDQYILALDQGTTSSRAILFDKSGSIVQVAQREFQQYFPNPGWVEHDPAEIWSTQLDVAKEVIRDSGIRPSQIASIGITNQRETTIVWDRRDGKALSNAIVWQDRRTAALCEALRADGVEDAVRERTGLRLDPYFSGSKVQWILDHVPGARLAADNGHLAFGTVDAWLVWNLTGGKTHVTDASNASRTLLFNIHRLEWDPDQLALFDIPASVLPNICSSSEIVAYSESSLLGAEIPIAGIAGDQQAALFGQLCTSEGMVKNTYGTGCFMLMNTGTKPTLSKNQLLSTVAWRVGDEVNYALEGSVFMGGAVVQWLRDGLGIIDSSKQVEALSQSVDSSGGVFLVPAFTGLGAPHWDPYARGSIHGMTRGTTSAHIARAGVESIAFQVADVINAMILDSGLPLTELRVDGGAAANNFLLQFQADLLGVPVLRPRVLETTALGVAYLAGLAVGYWSSVTELSSHWHLDRRFEPSMPKSKVDDLMASWTKALGRSKSWIDAE